MIIETTKLLKISTYAKQNNISHTYVYTLGKKGKLNVITIDGVKFVYNG
jgi:hypothetical protein